MHHPATYEKFADECRRLGETAPHEERRLLLEHANAWMRLAELVLRDGFPDIPPGD